MFRSFLFIFYLLTLPTAGFGEDDPWYHELDPLSGNWRVTYEDAFISPRPVELIVGIRPEMERICVEQASGGCLYRIEYTVNANRRVTYGRGISSYGHDQRHSSIIAHEISEDRISLFRGWDLNPRERRVDLERQEGGDDVFVGNWQFRNIHDQVHQGSETWVFLPPHVSQIGSSPVKVWARHDLQPPEEILDTKDNPVVEVALQEYDSYNWSPGRENPFWNQSERPHFRIHLYGENLIGPQHITFPDSVDFEIIRSDELRSERDANGNRHVIGQYIDVIMWSQARPGRHRLRVNDQNFTINVDMPGAEVITAELAPETGRVESVVQQNLLLRTSANEGTRELDHFLVEFEGQLHDDSGQVIAREAIAYNVVPQEYGCVPIDPAPAREDYLHRLRCTADVNTPARFQISVPEVPFLAWKITAISEMGVELDTWAGLIDIDLGPRNGDLAELQLAPRPQIFHVEPIYPQTGFDEVGAPLTTVPANGENKTRYLLVIGRDLPQRRAQTSLGNPDQIGYSFESSPQTLTEAELRHSHLAEGVKRFAPDTEDPIVLVSALEQAGMSVLVIRADLPPGTSPGVHGFNLNGENASWMLEYADTQFALRFERRRPAEPNAGIDALTEPVSLTFGGEHLYVSARVRPGHLNIPSINVDLTFIDGDTGQETQDTILLTRIDPGQYVSDPLRLGPSEEPGAINLSQGSGDYSRIRAEVTSEQIISDLPFALGVQAEVLIDAVPEQSDWHRYLEQAANCSRETFIPDSAEQLAFQPVTENIQDELKNTIIVNLETIGQNAHIGDHAAALLLRQRFRQMASAEEQRLTDLLNDPALLMAQYVIWRDAHHYIVQQNPEDPLLKFAVSSDPITQSLTLGDIVASDSWVIENLKVAGLNEKQILDWIEARKSYCQIWCPSDHHAAVSCWFIGLMPLTKSTPWMTSAR